MSWHQKQQTSWNAGTKGSAGGATFLQKALEGAVVSALGLADFGQAMSQAGGKTGGKGAVQKKQFCKWKGCKAAEHKKPTIGEKTECFGCGKHFRNQPPLQKLVDWAYDDELEQERKKAAAPNTQTGDKVAKGAGAAKGGGKGGKGGKSKTPQGAPAQKPDTTAEEEGLRKKRLEEMRAAKAGEPCEADEASPKAVEECTILEEVAAAWTMQGADANAKALQIDPKLAQELEEWDLRPLFETMKLDHLPAAYTLKSASEVVTSILSASKPCAGALAAGKLEAELTALKSTLVHYDAVGLEDLRNDTLAKIKATSEKLEKSKTPTAELQRKDVVAVKAQFIKDAQARTETALTGKRKAEERIAARTELIQNTLSMYQRLANAIVDRDLAIEAAHTSKSAEVESRDMEVCLMFDRKVEELAAKEAASKAAQATSAATATAAAAKARAESSSSAAAAAPKPDTTSNPELATALLELETFKQQQSDLMQKIQDLQAAAATPSAPTEEGSTVDADNDPASDVWREFSADISKVPVAPGSLQAMEPSDKAQVTTLKAFCAAIPWGAPTPAVTFHVLGTHPSIAHGLVGDGIWRDCWGEKHGRITTSHIVPYSLFSILKYAVDQVKETPDAKSVEEGKNRWAQAKTEAAERRVRGKPY